MSVNPELKRTTRNIECSGRRLGKCGTDDRLIGHWFDMTPHLRFVVDMQTISSTDARERLESLLDEVVREREPIAITRKGEGSVVLLPAEEFAAIEETLYLLSTSTNSDRLRQGLADFQAGKLLPGVLCD